MTARFIAGLFAVTMLGMAPASVRAQCEDAKLTAPDADAFDRLGAAIAANSEWLVVSARGDDDRGDAAGAVWVYRRNGTAWEVETKLLASDGAEGDNFGTDVALDGDVIVVGASGVDDRGDAAGAVYVFRFDGTQWIEEARLLATDGEAGDALGQGVDVDGNTIVAGSTSVAYVFRYDGAAWQEEQELEPVGDPVRRFGLGVAVEGAVIAVGGEYTQQDEFVQVYRYDGATWKNEAILRPSPPGNPDAFGSTLRLEGDALIVGAPDDREMEGAPGAVYVFRDGNAGWGLEQKVFPLPNMEAGYFGVAVGMAGDTLVVGASRDRQIERNTGACYLYRFDGATWVGEAKLLAGDLAGDDNLGTSVALVGDTVLAGAPQHDATADSTGAVYVLPAALIGPDCDGDRIADECATMTGVAGDCNGNRVPDSCDLDEGTSEDCDGNGVPDECDVDCNANARPDACDIADGSSDDRNVNGVPDECEGFDYCEASRLLASGDKERDWYGVAVAQDGDVLMVGQPYDTERGPDAGAVYVYRFDGATWAEETKLFFPDVAEDERTFGTSIAIDGDLAVIGAVQAGEARSGRADVFRYDGATWNHEATLYPSGDAFDAYFGRVVDVHDDVILVGARRYDFFRGAAFVFRFDGGAWNEEAVLVAPDGPESGDLFGAGVALGDGCAVVGAVGNDNENGAGAGAAYVYRESEGVWTGETKLLAPGGKPGDRFGGSIAIDGNRMIIGGFGSPPAYFARAHFYRLSEGAWVEDTSITASQGAIGHDVVPGQVALDDDLALLGFASDSTLGERAGAAFAFERVEGAWSPLHTLYPAGGQPGDDYGNAIALGGSIAYVGAPVRLGLGSLRIVDLRQEDCDRDGFCAAGGDACPAGDVNADGFADMADIVLILAAWGDCAGCPEDLDGNGVVDGADLAIVLETWS